MILKNVLIGIFTVISLGYSPKDVDLLESLNAERTKVLPFADDSAGLGIVSTNLDPEFVIYLYEAPLFDSSSDLELQPTDSLVFSRGEYSIEASGIASRPEFRPLASKLDYGILFLRAVTQTRHSIEIVVDEERMTTLWVASDAVNFVPWSSFFLSIHSVERIDKTTNPFHVGPDETTRTLANPSSRECLEVRAVTSQWMRVSSSEVCGDIQVENAWIKWWDDGELLITYNLLS